MSEELSEVRRRRTGSLSDNDIIELDQCMSYDEGEDIEDDEADNEGDIEDDEE